MKKILVLALLLGATMVQADSLSDLLNRQYNAKELSAHTMDSILNHNAKVAPLRFEVSYDSRNQIFRHSFEGECRLMDHEKDTSSVFRGTVRDAVISPDQRYVAYARANNLYLYKIDFHTEVPVTTDEDPDIINGTADWLYEEEFACTRLFEFSPDSKMLAYISLDEREVPSFAWQQFLADDAAPVSVEHNIYTQPKDFSLRYPKAGQNNAKASVMIYDIKTKGTQVIPLSIEDGYIPRLQWRTTTGGQELMLLTLNRDQTRMQVLAVNPRSTVSHPLYREESDKYFVDYDLFNYWQWLSDGRFVVYSEKNGWRSLFLYQADGTEIRQLTPDGMDLTAVYGVDEASQTVYYEAATTPMERQAYAVSLRKGAPVRLTTEAGTHTLTFSNDMRRVIDCYQSIETPNRYTLYSVNGTSWKKKEVLEDNHELLQRWEAFDPAVMAFTTIPTERGDSLNAYIIYPKNFDTSKKYPVMVIQYSGPASQRVLNRWRKRWGYYLAEQGYIVVDADSRGTDCRGRAWRNETYMQLGQKEAEDQVSVGLYMASLPYVDKNRMVMCGWSYGGYQTIRTMCEKNSPYKCGVAIAPVTDWRLYDSAYTERYMRRPMVNEDGYLAASVINRAADLKGKLLIVHGLADDNVHAQNALLFIEAMVEAGKQFEMQIYPDDNHFLRKRANYEHLHRRIMLFLEQNL